MKEEIFSLSKISVAISVALLSACNVSSDTSTVEPSTVASSIISGVAIDPELQGAKVFLDANENGAFDSDELNTTTDRQGNYSLEIPDNLVGKPLIVTGGIDRVTKKAFTGKLSAISEKGSNNQHITPITTLVEKFKKANSSLSIDEVKSKVATQLGLGASDLDKKPTDAGNENILKVALRVQKIVKAVKAESGKSADAIFEKVAQKLESKDLSTSITETVNEEVPSSTLAKAKIIDLDKEIETVDETALSTEGLALTVEKIVETVDTATQELDLERDLATDDTILVTDDEIKQEKGDRTLTSLGLGGLDDSTKSAIVNSDKVDIDNDEVSDIRAKLDNNELGLDNQQNANVRREVFLNDNGLGDLDPDTRTQLNSQLDSSGFDFNNISNDDFSNFLGDSNSFGDNEDLQARIQGLRNRNEQQNNLQTVGAGGGNNTTNDTYALADGKKVVGSIIKGPISDAVMKLKDATGTLVGSTISDKGLFSFPEVALTSDYYVIESLGGSYEDEATKTKVTMGDTQGLKTIFSKADLQAILDDKKYVAITPESTLLTELALNAMSVDGKDVATAITEASDLIYKTMIETTSPLALLPGDQVLLTGNFTTPFPDRNNGASEAFARNRAISFSYMVRDLGLTPNQVFDVLAALATDLKDGVSDGFKFDTDGDGVEETIDTTTEFGLARAKLFQNTTTKLRNGDLSEGQRQQLRDQGIDIDAINNRQAADEQALQDEIVKYLASSSLPALNSLPVLADEDGDPTDNKATYTLTAQENVDVTITTPDGSFTTKMWRYNNNALPVVIKANRGDAMTLKLDNQLQADSTIHWHGFKIPADMDGGPDLPVAPNTQKTYSFTMDQPAAPMWFHPHPDMEKEGGSAKPGTGTGVQVYMGLTGLYLLNDDISKQLEADGKLPSGDKDIPLIVQDRRFKADDGNGFRELEYKTSPRDNIGMFGETVLVNGSVVPNLDVSNTMYRFKLYSVANARTFDFAFSDGREFTVVGTDGGLLKNPVKVTSLMLGAAERAEIVVDFGQDTVGDKVLLISKPVNIGGMGAMGNMGGQQGGMGDMSGMGSQQAASSTDPTKATAQNSDNSGMDSQQSSGGMGDMSGMGSQQSSGGMGDMSGMDSQQSSGGMGDMSGMGSQQSSGGMGGMSGMGAQQGGMGGMGGIPGQSGSVLMRFNVATSESETITLYDELPASAEITTRLDPATADNVGNERQFVMSVPMMGGGMQGQNASGTPGQGGMQQMGFVINGKAFKMDEVNEFVATNAKEIWSISNMSPMAHPFHAHAIQYQIIDRNGVPASGVDLGWKDTFLVQPGETIRIIGQFEPVNQGDYMYHCHILEHEDNGMMGYFRVGDTGNVDNFKLQTPPTP